MIEINETTETAASPETAFDFIAEPRNHLQFTPSLMDISEVRDAEVGKRGEYSFKMVGTTLDGEFVDTTFDRPTERSYDLRGDLEGSITWTITPTDEGSRIDYEATVDLPGPDLLDTVTDPIARRFMQREAESILETLSDLLDEQSVGAEQPA